MDELLQQVLTALRGMWRRRWIGLAVAWAVAVIGAVVLLRIPDRYEATARVYVDTQTVLKPLMAGLAVQPNVDEQINMLARTLIARPNVEKIIRSADLDLAAKTQIDKDKTRRLGDAADQVQQRRAARTSTAFPTRTPTRSAPSASCRTCCRCSWSRASATSGATPSRPSLHRRADQDLREEARGSREPGQGVQDPEPRLHRAAPARTTLPA